jgi:CDP-diacylglycerol--glycerol-3-phosphate 3-phosphatidyltransferase
MIRDITKIPNLVTLSRLLFLIPIAWFISRPAPIAKAYTLICITLAAITDFLDGFLARRLNQKTNLGLLLDPLADKIMAAVVAVLLIVYRDFPVWVAAVVIGRDLLIAAAGLFLTRRIGHVPASNLTGKYSFAALAVLLISYILVFPFGIDLFLPLTLVLLAASLINYALSTVRRLQGKERMYADTRAAHWLRTGAVLVVSFVYIFQLGRFYRLF